jgi:nucleotide-binding universal stress UspA family protein
MTTEAPTGPLLLCYDGSQAAQAAIRAASTLLGTGRPSRLLYIYKPMERSLGVAQGLTGGKINAPVSGETEAAETVDAGLKIAREAGFDVEPILVAADRETADIIISTAEELDAPAIVMGQRGRSAIKSAILGSVSRDVVNSYHRPVILV